MADDKNFKTLIDEVGKTNKIIVDKLIVEQKKSQEISTELITKSQDKTTDNVKKGNEEQAQQAEKQLALDKISADKQKKLDEAQLAAEKRKEARQKILDRLTKLRKKAPSAIKNAAKFATYQNRVMRNLAKGIGKLNRGLGIGKAFKAGKDTLFGTIKKLVQGGFAIGGILLLDKFFNSDNWPKFIELLRTKVIPGVKDAITFITGLFTGTLDEMKTDDTAGKFKTSVMSFFKLVGSLFGMGRDTLVDDNDNPIYGKNGKKLQKGYFQQIKDNFTQFKDDFIIFFESLSRSLAKGLFGYENEEKDFFKGVREDMAKMLKRIVRGIGEAFYEAYPLIGKLLGMNSPAANRVLDFKEDNPKFVKRVDDMSFGQIKKTDFDEKDEKLLKDYAKLLQKEQNNQLPLTIGLDFTKNALIKTLANKFDMELERGDFLQRQSQAQAAAAGLGIDAINNSEIIDKIFSSRVAKSILGMAKLKAGMANDGPGVGKLNSEFLNFLRKNTDNTITPNAFSSDYDKIKIDKIIDFSISKSLEKKSPSFFNKPIIISPTSNNNKTDVLNHSSINTLASDSNGFFANFGMAISIH